MSCADLSALHWFWGLLALFLFYRLAQKGKYRAEEAFAPSELFAELTAPGQPEKRKKRKWKAILFFVSFTFGILALMRPQLGFEWEESRKGGLDILVAVDTSRSMLAEDVEPNRLAQAQQGLKRWVGNLKGDRIGLIAFAGNASLVCPLTVDYDAFRLAVDTLDVHIIPMGGTDLSRPVEEAVKIFGREKGTDKVLFLLSDGETHTGSPKTAAESARKEGIKIFGVGIGSREGGLIPLVNVQGQREYLKDDQGRVVKTSMQEAPLQQIADPTGGKYFRGDGVEKALDWVYREYLVKMEKGEFQGNMKKRSKEWFQIPLLFSLLLLLGETSGNERRGSKILKSPILALGVILLAFSFVFLPGCQGRMDAAYEFYQKGQYREAIKVYQKALAESPDSPILNYNFGVLHYKIEGYQEAFDYLTLALTTEDRELEAKAVFNLGNCKVRLGERSEKTNLAQAAELYQDALAYFRRATEANPQDEDAFFNYRWVKGKIPAVLAKLDEEKKVAPGSEKQPVQLPEKPREKTFSTPPELAGPSFRSPLDAGKMGNLTQAGVEKIPPSPPETKEITRMSKEEAENLLEEYHSEEELLARSQKHLRPQKSMRGQKDW